MINLLVALNAVLPVFLLIVLGIFLKRIGLIDDRFITRSSRLVFNVALPVLIFRTVSRADFSKIFSGKEVLAVILLVSGGFLLIYLISQLFIKDGAMLGSFVQCSFRSNTAIVGLAVIANLFGESGLAKAAIPMVFIFPMYNIYSVLSMTLPMKWDEGNRFLQTVKSIATNPLIIAVLVSLPFAFFSFSIPAVADTFLSYLSRMALPLSLLGVGGSLNFQAFRKKVVPTLFSSSIKIVLYPVITAAALIPASIRGESLGVLVILMGCPTAISSYIMADAMGADSELAAGVIAVTTLGSVATLGSAIFILKSLGLI